MNFSRFHLLALGTALLATPAWASPCDPKLCDPKPCDPQHRAGCKHSTSASVVVAPRAAAERVVVHTTGSGCNTLTLPPGAAPAQGERALVVTGPAHAHSVISNGSFAIAQGAAPSHGTSAAVVAGSRARGETRTDRVNELLTRVRSAPSAPAPAEPAEFPAPPAFPAAPCPPEPAAVAEPAQSDVVDFPRADADAVDTNSETGQVEYEHALAALVDAEAALQDGTGQWEERAAELAAASELFARTEAAQDGALERSAEAHARAAQAIERARVAHERSAAAAKERADVEAGRDGQRTRTFRRNDAQGTGTRSLEERIARLEALAQVRHPERAQAHGGSRSLEERVAELEALLDATPLPSQNRSALGGALKRLQELPRTPLAPGLYSLDSQSGALRALAPLPEGRGSQLRSRAPAGGSGGGGGARAEAPRGFAQFERAAPSARGTAGVQRDEVERRMAELRAQMTRLREQMNTMREEIEALPRRDE